MSRNLLTPRLLSLPAVTVADYANSDPAVVKSGRVKKAVANAVQQEGESGLGGAGGKAHPVLLGSVCWGRAPTPPGPEIRQSNLMPENESAFLSQMLRLLDGLFLQKASLKPSRIAESSLVPEMEALFFLFFFWT